MTQRTNYRACADAGEPVPDLGGASRSGPAVRPQATSQTASASTNRTRSWAVPM